jgi:hypothetical protein
VDSQSRRLNEDISKISSREEKGPYKTKRFAAFFAFAAEGHMWALKSRWWRRQTRTYFLSDLSTEGPAGPGDLGILWSWLVRCRKSDNLTVKYHWTEYIVSWCPSGIVCWMRISARSVQEERKGLTEGPAGPGDSDSESGLSCLVRCRKSDTSNLTVDITEPNTLDGGYSVDPAKWGYQQDQFKRRERALPNEKICRMFRMCWGSHVTPSQP